MEPLKAKKKLLILAANIDRYAPNLADRLDALAGGYSLGLPANQPLLFY